MKKFLTTTSLVMFMTFGAYAQTPSQNCSVDGSTCSQNNSVVNAGADTNSHQDNSNSVDESYNNNNFSQSGTVNVDPKIIATGQGGTASSNSNGNTSNNDNQSKATIGSNSQTNGNINNNVTGGNISNTGSADVSGGSNTQGDMTGGSFTQGNMTGGNNINNGSTDVTNNGSADVTNNGGNNLNTGSADNYNLGGNNLNNGGNNLNTGGNVVGGSSSANVGDTTGGSANVNGGSANVAGGSADISNNGGNVVGGSSSTNSGAINSAGGAGGNSNAVTGDSNSGVKNTGNSRNQNRASGGNSRNVNNIDASNNSQYTYKEAARTAYAPQLNGYGQQNCFGDTNPSGSFTAGVQTFGFGVSAGRSKASNVCAATQLGHMMERGQGGLGASYLAQQDPMFHQAGRNAINPATGLPYLVKKSEMDAIRAERQAQADRVADIRGGVFGVERSNETAFSQCRFVDGKIFFRAKSSSRRQEAAAECTAIIQNERANAGVLNPAPRQTSQSTSGLPAGYRCPQGSTFDGRGCKLN